MKYIIDMSEGWKPGLHEKCAMQKVCIVTDVYDENGFPCPLASAKEAVQIKYWDTENCAGNSKINSKTVTLYAVEVKP